MSVPVLLAIVLSMKTGVQGISRAAGYHYDVKAGSVRTKPEALEPIPSSETPMVLLGHELEAMGRDFKGSRPVSIEDRWRITLHARVDAVTADPEGWITAFANFSADLEKALTVDIAANRNIYGGLVLYAYVMQPIPFFGPKTQNQVYIEQPVEVLLQRTYTQP